MCWIFHETLPIWLPIRCPLKKIVYASWKVFKICLRASKRWLILSASVRCFENFWSLGRCFDLFVDKHKHAFSLVEKWPVGSVLKFRDIPDCTCSTEMLLDSRRVFPRNAKIEQAIERKALQDELKQLNSADKVYWGSLGNILKPKLNEIKNWKLTRLSRKLSQILICLERFKRWKRRGNHWCCRQMSALTLPTGNVNIFNINFITGKSWLYFKRHHFNFNTFE